MPSGFAVGMFCRNVEWGPSLSLSWGARRTKGHVVCSLSARRSCCACVRCGRCCDSEPFVRMCVAARAHCLVLRCAMPEHRCMWHAEPLGGTSEGMLRWLRSGGVGREALRESECGRRIRARTARRDAAPHLRASPEGSADDRSRTHACKIALACVSCRTCARR